MFDNNFGKCGPILKILSPTDSWEKMKEFWKLIHICQNYCQTSRGILFSGNSVYTRCRQRNEMVHFFMRHPVYIYDRGSGRGTLHNVLSSLCRPVSTSNEGMNGGDANQLPRISILQGLLLLLLRCSAATCRRALTCSNLRLAASSFDNPHRVNIDEQFVNYANPSWQRTQAVRSRML